MFSMLKRKYTRWLLFPVTIVFMLYGLVVFFLYSNLLEKDYNNKISYFGEQQVANVEQIFKHIELNMKMFLLEQDLTADDTHAQYKISNGLKKFKNVNLDISSIYFVDSVSGNTLFLNEYGQVKDNDFLLTQYYDLFSNPSEAIQWYYLKYEDPEKDSLLCLESVAANGEDYYTLGIVISTSVILPTVTHTLGDSGIFSDFIFDTYLLPDNYAILLMNAAEKEEVTFSKFEDEQSKAYFTSRIGTYPFTFYLNYSKEALNEMRLSFFIGMLAICIIIWGAAYITQKLFINRMAMALQTLSDKFSDFINTVDDEPM